MPGYELIGEEEKQAVIDMFNNMKVSGDYWEGRYL